MGFSIFGRKPSPPGTGLEIGWQFYARPNTLEPVGTVFRIDGDGAKFPVDRFDLPTEEGPEAGVKVTQRLAVKASILARFLELIDLTADASAGKAKTLEFEIHEPVRTLSTDVAVNAALKSFLEKFAGKRGNTYYLIRQTRSATRMTYRLSADFVAELGGEGKLNDNLKAGANLSVDHAGRYEIHQTFPERLLVTFQPDRIDRVRAGLAGGQSSYGLTPVRQTLVWRETSADTMPRA